MRCRSTTELAAAAAAAAAAAGAPETVRGRSLTAINFRLAWRSCDRTGCGGVWGRSKKSEHLGMNGWIVGRRGREDEALRQWWCRNEKWNEVKMIKTAATVATWALDGGERLSVGVGFFVVEVLHVVIVHRRPGAQLCLGDGKLLGHSWQEHRSNKSSDAETLSGLWPFQMKKWLNVWNWQFRKRKDHSGVWK